MTSDVRPAILIRSLELRGQSGRREPVPCVAHYVRLCAVNLFYQLAKEHPADQLNVTISRIEPILENVQSLKENFTSVLFDELPFTGNGNLRGAVGEHVLLFSVDQVNKSARMR